MGIAIAALSQLTEQQQRLQEGSITVKGTSPPEEKMTRHSLPFVTSEARNALQSRDLT